MPGTAAADGAGQHGPPLGSGLQQPTTTTTTTTTPSERIFEQLDVIRALHRSITKDHARLEGLESRDQGQSSRAQPGGAGAGAGAGVGAGVGGVESGKLDQGRKEEHGATSASATNNEHGGDQESKPGPATYEQMAEDFTRRHEGVEGIMRQVSS